LLDRESSPIGPRSSVQRKTKAVSVNKIAATTGGVFFRRHDDRQLLAGSMNIGRLAAEGDEQRAVTG